MNRTLTCLIATGALQSIASAGLSASFEWRQVDNTMFGPELDPINGAAWIAHNWVTYDLYLTMDAIVNGVNFGSAPGEEHLGLVVGDTVFNTIGPTASNFESPFQNMFPAARYDTFADLGSNNTDGMAQDELLGVALNGLVPQNGVLRGAWAHNPVNGGTPQDASQGIRLLRLSVDADSIGAVPGIGSGLIQIGVDAGTVEIPITTIPAPGAAALIGIGGVFAARRRR